MRGSKVIEIRSYPSFLVISITLIHARYKNCSFWKCESKPFIHPRKILFNYSKLYSMLSVSSQRKYNFYHQNTLLDAFRTNSRNVIGKNPSMVIPLLANQDLTPMLHQYGGSSKRGQRCKSSVKSWTYLDESIQILVKRRNLPEFCSCHSLCCR